jgi:hypothetical protein
MKAEYKWRFAIGTTSRVPDSGGLHYLIADFDENGAIDFPFLFNCNNFIVQRTEHGWHVYTDQIGTFDSVITKLKHIGADKAWIRIAERRGYLFLADKSEIHFPWPVEHMVIHMEKNDGEEEAQNS